MTISGNLSELVGSGMWIAVLFGLTSGGIVCVLRAIWLWLFVPGSDLKVRKLFFMFFCLEAGGFLFFFITQVVIFSTRWSTCNANDVRTAYQNIGTLLDEGNGLNNTPWSSYRGSLTDIRDCMGANDADDFSEITRQFMIKNWDRIDDLARYKKEDAHFYQFVFLALKMEMPNEDTVFIGKRAATNCPHGGDEVCKDILYFNTIGVQ